MTHTAYICECMAIIAMTTVSFPENVSAKHTVPNVLEHTMQCWRLATLSEVTEHNSTITLVVMRFVAV